MARNEIEPMIGEYDAYLTEDAIVCFFQQYDIAQYASGILEYEVPLHELD